LAITCQGGDVGIVFLGGNLALDFVGTLNERFSTRVEQLREPPDLGGWFVAAGVVDDPPEVSDADLQQAVELREVLFGVIARQIEGHPPRVTHAERAAINAAGAYAPPVSTLTAAGRVTRNGDLRAGLSAVARAAIALFELTDDAALKWCADEDCTHPFLDTSRGHRRRWCGMSGCGDRAKAAAYRARKRA
jgi:predicted RNA-binding Zn ribbon-like protein